jgi:predicted nuclease of predicted toxin-antitoxin system
VKLLFDVNLSPRLPERLIDAFPDSAHVSDFGLLTADDEVIWRFAAEHEFAIVSKDGDFQRLSFLFGPPPKVVWLRIGNCTTDVAELTLRRHMKMIGNFEQDASAAFLVLDRA